MTLSIRPALSVLLVLALAVPVIADDDNGESTALVVRAKTDPTLGELRCVDKDCSGFVLDSIYLGSRTECVFSVDPREPFVDGAEVAWDDCDTEDCEWCYPKDDGTRTGCLPSTCTDSCELRCSNNDPCDADGRCADGFECTRKCGNGDPCFDPTADRLRWRLPSKAAIIASPTLATCDVPDAFYAGHDDTSVRSYCVFVGTTDNHFLAIDEKAGLPPPKLDGTGNIGTESFGNLGSYQDLEGAQPASGSCLWRFKVDNQVWRNAIAPTKLCNGTDDPDAHVFVPSKKGHLTKFDRYPRLDESLSCADSTCESGDNPLSCPLLVRDWETRIDDNSLEVLGGLVLPQNLGSTSPLCVDSSRVVIAGTSRGFRGVKIDVDDETVTTAGNDAYEDVLAIEAAGAVVGEYYNGEGRGVLEKGERYGVQDLQYTDDTSIARYYSGFGASGNDTSGVAALEMDVATGELGPAWKFERGQTNLAGDTTHCVDDDSDGIDADLVQLHRTSPALSHDGSYVFVTNRHASGADLAGAVLAFQREGSGTNPVLVACAYPSSGDGIVSAPAQATVTCGDAPQSRCCVDESDTPLTGRGTDFEFDRLIILSKAQEVFIYDFCEYDYGETHPHTVNQFEYAFGPDDDDDGMPEPAGHIEDWEGHSFAELRALPVVAEEIGTFYFQDNNPSGERIFAYDLFDADTLKWVYDASGATALNDHGNPQFCKFGVPAGSRDCYPAPLPHATTQTSGGAVEVTVCPDFVTVESLGAYSSSSCEDNRLVSPDYTTDSNGFDSVALDKVFGVEWTNDDKSPPARGRFAYDSISGCFEGALQAGDFEGSGPNTFLLTMRNKLGKLGQSQIEISAP